MVSPPIGVSFSARRRATEDQWYARVRDAKQRFDFAVALLAQAYREPGTTFVEPARAMEEQAREEFARELEIFTNLVVRGKMPGDEASG